jgi:hypothetical protein
VLSLYDDIDKEPILRRRSFAEDIEAEVEPKVEPPKPAVKKNTRSSSFITLTASSIHEKINKKIPSLMTTSLTGTKNILYYFVALDVFGVPI